MPTMPVLNTAMEPLREIEVPEEVFGRPYRRDIVYEAVNNYRANQRLGTHSTKNRSEVKGSRKKLWRQKHTGRARMGDAASPLWRHGGIVFGPKPRDYSYRIPKKVRHAAYRTLLSERLRRGLIGVVDELSVPEAKTKAFTGRYAGWINEHGTVLFVDMEPSREVILAARNIPGIKVTRVEEVNVYDLARYRMAVFTEKALARLMEVLKP